MLELRPNCENCNKLLLANATDAMICSFECTFCKKCVDELLHNVCPNCGGGFAHRPIRPANNLKSDNFLGQYPATEKPTYKPVNPEEHRQFSKNIKSTAPEHR